MRLRDSFECYLGASYGLKLVYYVDGTCSVCLRAVYVLERQCEWTLRCFDEVSGTIMRVPSTGIVTAGRSHILPRPPKKAVGCAGSQHFCFISHSFLLRFARFLVRSHSLIDPEVPVTSTMPNDPFFLLLQKPLPPDLLSLVVEDWHVKWLRYGMEMVFLICLEELEWFWKCVYFICLYQTLIHRSQPRPSNFQSIAWHRHPLDPLHLLKHHLHTTVDERGASYKPHYMFKQYFMVRRYITFGGTKGGIKLYIASSVPSLHITNA
jgi:hypothetical protein